MSFCPHCEQKITPPDSYSSMGEWVATLDPSHPIRVFLISLPSEQRTRVMENPAPDYNKVHILKLMIEAEAGKPKAQSQLRMMAAGGDLFV